MEINLIKVLLVNLQKKLNLKYLIREEEAFIFNLHLVHKKIQIRKKNYILVLPEDYHNKEVHVVGQDLLGNHKKVENLL